MIVTRCCVTVLAGRIGMDNKLKNFVTAMSYVDFGLGPGLGLA